MAKDSVKKTNAMRILDNAKVAYNVHSYNDDTEHKLELGAALRVAEKIGQNPEAVFKTIVMRSDSKQIYVFCVPANTEVNLKKAKAAAGVKSLESVKPEELNSLTDYIRGGCSPLGMKKQFATFIDETVLLHDTVFISGGLRGVQIELAPNDLVALSNAATADIAS